jgi:hypothetical protein
MMNNFIMDVLVHGEEISKIYRQLVITVARFPGDHLDDHPLLKDHRA